ncbi:hypothetical protein EVAR_63255_1 [Eumeta japonica]|uniref:Uncharacterized protein n=1 Tax=Eumeta variegata TaxID=151549 RepID=A0A4C2A296_EUMVA|nr:hypothetical protein EVAR_63255_1 [Eumeta japonica]
MTFKVINPVRSPRLSVSPFEVSVRTANLTPLLERTLRKYLILVWLSRSKFREGTDDLSQQCAPAGAGTGAGRAPCDA